MKQAILIFSFTFIFLNSTAVANAQSFSMELTPQLYELVSQRDKTITLPYTITNLGDPQAITLSMYTTSIKDNEGNTDISYYQQKDNQITFEILNSTVSLDKPFLLKSKNTLDFELTITIPESVNESDYLFSLIAETEPQQGFGNTSGVIMQGGIGTNIVLTVTDSGSIDQKGKIAQYEILDTKKFTFLGKEYIFFNSGDSIPIILIAANSGMNVTKASGSITVIPQNVNDKDEFPSFTIPPQLIPAGSQRILQATNGESCENSELCKKNTSLLVKAPLLGIYKLSSVVSFGETSQISYGNITFISFPLVEAASIILLLVGLIFIFLFLRKKFAK